MGEIVDLKEATKATPEIEVDAGWIAAAIAINEIGSSIAGADFEVMAFPDPQGLNPKGKSGIYVSIQSIEKEDIGAQIIVPFNVDTLTNIRSVLIAVMAQLYAQVRAVEEESTKSKLLVPEKTLLVPDHSL